MRSQKPGLIAKQVVRLLAALGLAWSVAAHAQLIQTDLPLGDGPDPYAEPVRNMVAGIVGYSRWPEDLRTVRLCVVGPTDHTDRLDTRSLARGRLLRPAQVAAADASAANCDAVYLGRLSLVEQRRIADSLQGAAVLTIAENDPGCRSRAMFCLLFEADGLSFRVNLDAVSRSQIRIDPRVLRMGAEARSTA